ncbi:MAG: choice-of-anchor D domain-containing protein [Myxococcales bacterium]
MRNLTWATLTLIAAFAFNCSDGGNQEAKGEIKPEKLSVGFEQTCPKPSDPKYEVTFPTVPVVLTNVGKATSYLNKFEVESAYKEVFVVDQTKVPETIAAGSSVEIPVTFKPNQSGTIVGKLHVAGDLPEGADTFDITLSGEGKSFTPFPVFSASCLSPNTMSPLLDGCTPTSSGTRTIRFNPTPTGGYVDVPVTLKNAGCPNLSITNIKVTTTSADDSKEGFALVDAATTSLTAAGGNGTAVVNVRFSPQTAGTVYKGTLTFETNDPDAADATVTIKLDGEGTAASLWLDKTICDYAKLSGPCNGQFEIRNSGTLPLKVSKVSLKKNNPMFKLENGDAFTNVSVPGGSYATLIKVTYDPAGNPACPGPLLATIDQCNDTLVVESDAGTAEAELRGGSWAILRTFPTTAIDFNAAVGGTPLDHNPHFETLLLRNEETYAGQLDLTIKDLVIDDSRKAFTVMSTNPLPAGCEPEAKPFAPNTVIKPGESFTACLKFTSDVAGGIFSTNMNVLSTDPSYPDPNGLLMELKATAICESKPTAAIEVRAQGTPATCPCTDTTCPMVGTCNVKLPTGGVASASVDISGESSFSPTYKFDENGMCAEDKRIYTGLTYKWELRNPQDGSASLSPDGISTSPITTLTYSKSGQHIIKLTVTDANGRTGEASYVVSPSLQ